MPPFLAPLWRLALSLFLFLFSILGLSLSVCISLARLLVSTDQLLKRTRAFLVPFALFLKTLLARFFLLFSWAKALEAVTEAQTWCAKGGAVPPALAAACAPAYDLQPDVPFPERKDVKDPYTRS